MMCVKLTFAPVVRASWLFKMRRLTSRRRAGTVRTLVAVGTARLASMLATMREAAPRSGVASSFSLSVAARGAGAGAPGFDPPETAGAPVGDAAFGGTTAAAASGGTDEATGP